MCEFFSKFTMSWVFAKSNIFDESVSFIHNEKSGRVKQDRGNNNSHFFIIGHQYFFIVCDYVLYVHTTHVIKK